MVELIQMSKRMGRRGFTYKRAGRALVTPADVRHVYLDDPSDSKEVSRVVGDGIDIWVLGTPREILKELRL